VAVLVGLILVRLTGQPVLDPIVALLVVGLIVRAAYGTMRKAITNLMDTRLPEDEEREIRALLAAHRQVANYHGLRTRKAGNERHIVAHIVVSRDYTVEEGHRIAEEVEDLIRALHNGTSITVHVEPCTPECEECPSPCDSSGRRRADGAPPPGHEDR
jgi:cation diffusion facilitator family transporter